MKDKIMEYINARADDGMDPLYVLARLFDAGAVLTTTAGWDEGRLRCGFEVNPVLPDLPDDVSKIVLTYGHGRPASCELADNDPIYVDWPVGGWLWRMMFDNDDVPTAMPLAGLLLEKLPGSPIVKANLVADQTELTFTAQADGEQICIEGVLGDSEFQVRCERTVTGLLRSIQDIHEGCTCECPDAM